MRLTGRTGPVLLGAHSGGAFAERVRAGLDPDGRFAAAPARVHRREEALA